MKDPLIKKLKNHDHAAFEKLVHKYLPLVSTVVYNIGGSKLTKEDMEEVISDVQKAFPDYTLHVAMDTDFAEE